MLLTRSADADHSLTIEHAKAYLKLTGDDDNASLQRMLNTAWSFAERYSGRELQAATWTLLLDKFEDRICLRKSPVDAITSVDRLVSGSFSAVSTDDYYLKKGSPWSEVLLASDGDGWPSDADDIEHNVRVVFTVVAHDAILEIETGILKHLAYLYENRGDWDDGDEGASLSGAAAIYDQFAVQRV
jgi:uncharacterized phiE125 gp8 family phage protein